MRHERKTGQRTLLAGVVVFAAMVVGLATWAQEVKKDVPYVPTPQAVVDRMLEMANVSSDDVIYDLGSGDRRIVITAAKEYGARGVGVDIDPQRVAEARQNARKAGVSDRVTFVQGDLFEVPLGDATVVTLYLLPDVNLKLRPKLMRELNPGIRVVSHDLHMGDWKPEKTENVEGHTIYYWVIPEAGSRAGEPGARAPRSR